MTREVWFAVVHVVHVKKMKSKKDKVTRSKHRTSVIGKDDEEVRSLPTFTILLNRLSTKDCENRIEKIEHLHFMSKTSYDV